MKSGSQEFKNSNKWNKLRSQKSHEVKIQEVKKSKVKSQEVKKDVKEVKKVK